MPPQPPPVVYTKSIWLKGLEEQVTVVKTPSRMVVERADGRIQGYASVMKLDQERYRERNGVATPMLAERLANAVDSELLNIALRYNVEGLQQVIDNETGEARKVQVRDLVMNAGAAIGQSLASQGFEEIYRSVYMPAIFGRIEAVVVRQLIFDERFNRIDIDDPIVVEGNGEYSTDPNVEHGIDTWFNTCGSCGMGNYGEDVRVGMVEMCFYDSDVGSREIYHEHDAFECVNGGCEMPPPPVPGPVYQAAGFGCMADADCFSTTGCTGNVRCEAGRCISNHASEVASVISSSKSGVPSGAAKVDLYLANGSKPNTTAGYASAFDYLFDQGVELVNETHAGINTDNYGLQVADYYASLDMLPIQSAGNNPVVPACSKSANSICVGAAEPKAGTGAGLWPSSGWVNPASDREEPDVVALGDDVQVLDFRHASDWSGTQNGTSYSAPAITNMLAHYLHGCGLRGSLALRAITRNAAWAWSPADVYWYSTPGIGFDFHDGAGWLSARNLLHHCQSGSGSHGGVTIDLEGGGNPPAGDETGDQLGDPPPQSFHPQSNLAPESTSRKEKDLKNLGALSVGDRVRFTYTWDTCTTSNDAHTASVLGVDLDIFLLNTTTGVYVYGSQSIHDNTEGFDIIISSGMQAGNYKVVASWAASDYQNCGSNTTVRTAWAAKWGAPW